MILSYCEIVNPPKIIIGAVPFSGATASEKETILNPY